MKNCLILLVMILTFKGFSQTYDLKQNFVMDSTYIFQIEKANIDSNEPETFELTTKTDVSATFEEHNNNIKVTWVYGESRLSGPAEYVKRLDYDDHNIFKESTIEFLITKEGKYLSLLNFADLIKQIEKNNLEAFKDLNTVFDSAQIMKTFDIMRPSYETEEALIGTFFNEINVYFNSSEETITEGMESSTQFPFLQTGKIMTFYGEYNISFNFDDYMMIHYSGKVDKNEFINIMKDENIFMPFLTFNKIDKNEIPNISCSQKNTFTYNKQKKYLMNASSENTLRYENSYRSQIIEVRLKE